MRIVGHRKNRITGSKERNRVKTIAVSYTTKDYHLSQKETEKMQLYLHNFCFVIFPLILTTDVININDPTNSNVTWIAKNLLIRETYLLMRV